MIYLTTVKNKSLNDAFNTVSKVVLNIMLKYKLQLFNYIPGS